MLPTWYLWEDRGWRWTAWCWTWRKENRFYNWIPQPICWSLLCLALFYFWKNTTEHWSNMHSMKSEADNQFVPPSWPYESWPVIVHEIGRINGPLAFMIFEGTLMLFWGDLNIIACALSSLYMYLNISHSILEYQDVHYLLLVWFALRNIS